MKRLTLLSGLMLASLAVTVACASSAPSGDTVSTPSSEIATPAVDAMPPDTEPDAIARSTVQATGTFVSGEHPTSGTVSVVTEEEARYIEFSENFQTDPGPDLFVILHRSPDVIGTTEPPAHAIREEDYVLLEPLQAVNGSQRYTIPADVDLSQYASVAIWCRQFNATFGAAALQ